MCSEEAMEEFLETDIVSEQTIRKLIRDRKLFPCLFGSALRMDGVEALLKLLDCYTEPQQYPKEFSARVYKVGRDKDGREVYEGDVLIDELEQEYTAEIYDRPEKIHALKLKEASDNA